MSKIIFGTSKLGWDLNESKFRKINSVLNKALKENIDIHISPSYGYSLNFIKNCKNLKKSKSYFMIKLSYKTKEIFYHQLFYVMKIIGSKKKIDIQIDEFFDTRMIKELTKSIDLIKKIFLIRDVYLTPLKRNYLSFLKKTRKFTEFNYAIHYSLIENNFQKNFLKKLKKLDKKTISLRGLGGGINNISFEDFYDFNDNDKKFLFKKKDLFFKKHNMSEIEGRAQFILKNPLIHKTIISSSKIKNFNYLLKLEKSKFSKKKIDNLEKFFSKHFLLKYKKKIINNNMFYKRYNMLIFITSLNDIKKQNLVSYSYIIKSILTIPQSFINLIIYKVKIFSLNKLLMK